MAHEFIKGQILAYMMGRFGRDNDVLTSSL